jgi:hypothetical protein
VLSQKANSDRAGRWLGNGRGPRDELTYVVWALNGFIYRELEGDEFGDYDDIQRKTPPLLRELVQCWQAYGSDLQKFHRADPTTWADLHQYLKNHAPLLSYTPGSGGANLISDPNPGKTPYQEAIRFFLMLILNPEWNRLAGPCARCDNFYIRGSARNKVYCSRSCGTRATALAATKSKRDEERAEKLRRVTDLCQRWRRSNTKKDWKDWICQHDISKTFLTRAVNKGDLKAPVRN